MIHEVVLGTVATYRDFSNASVTTMLPLWPPKVNVGCWTRELNQGFKVLESPALTG